MKFKDARQAMIESSTHPIRALLPAIERVAPGRPLAIVGMPGVGKSTFLRVCARCHPRAVLASCEPGLGRVGLLESIIEVMPGRKFAARRRARDGRQALATVLHSFRADSKNLLLLDDAHRLYKPGLEMLEQLSRRVGVVLCGSGELERRLRTVPTLQERLGTPLHLRPLEEADLAELAAERMPWLSGQQLERLLCQTGGRWSRLERLFSRCQEIVARRLLAVDERSLELACRELFGEAA